MQTVKEFLSEEEIADVREGHEQMFYESFMHDGLIYDTALKAIEECCGEDGLEIIAKRFARKEFERTIDMTVEDYIDYYGDNDTYVVEKWERLRKFQKNILEMNRFAESYLALFDTVDRNPSHFKKVVIVEI